MKKIIRIGTRESELAVWQASLVKNLLKENGIDAELIYVKSEGDINLVTPLYEMGVQGIFTKTLDVALLNKQIDIAVHSMKDVPTVLPEGIQKASVLKRGTYKDLLVYKDEKIIEDWGLQQESDLSSRIPGTIATSSIRRKAQWLRRYPEHRIDNLRGNVNTRLAKLKESSWNGAIFAAAGLERINLRPETSIELDWMLPAPAQGAIMVVCRSNDDYCLETCNKFNDEGTDWCTLIERDFLHELKGGCSTPISALAIIKDSSITFQGNICGLDGANSASVEGVALANKQIISEFGKKMAWKLLQNTEAVDILKSIQHG
ncbi:MAG: hydroxymethylbilane synthase [Ginsengibacter sp.]